MEGVEIVIRPRHVERFIFGVVILLLLVLLIIKWDSGDCTGTDVKSTGTDADQNTAQGSATETNTTNATITLTDACANGVKDGSETDVDCGGSCPKCAEYKACNVDLDCASSYCYQHIKCMVASCSDGIKNQDETDIDCGGKCGGYFYDAKCNAVAKPTYSGKIELTILDVSTSINAGSGFVKVDSVQFKVINGMSEEKSLTAYVYLRDYRGIAFFSSSTSGDEVPAATIELAELAAGTGTATETTQIKRTLPEIEPSDKYQVVVELKDSADKLVKSATWTNK